MKGMKMNDINLNKYADFTFELASLASKDLETLIERLRDLDEHETVNISLLMTGAFGLGSEGGEFQEIVKKILFQGKPLNDENIFHMKRELGDIAWYWVNACNALAIDPNEVLAENVEKLKARYPGGDFDAYYSENRKEGDI
jgi:NTP pyrophosphatase (non-canonical NTP hydrolase)